MANLYYVLEIETNYYEIEEPTTLIIEAYDFSVPSGIPESIVTEKGSMIVATGDAAVTETGAPSANNQVWISDDTEAKGGRWAAQTGGGGDVDLTNQSGADQVAGTVVIWDSSNDKSFTLTTTLRDRRVAGILSEDIANGATGKVAVVGKIVTVRVQGSVSRGMWLIASATTGRAQADGYTRPDGAVALALTAYSGGGAGTVDALVRVDHYLGASAGKGYALGGNAASYIATTQVLNLISETCSIVAGAALSVARTLSASASFADKGITFGGNTGAASLIADRTTYSTDVTAAVSSANLLVARTNPGAFASTTNAYTCGGDNAGAQSTGYKTPSSTETLAAQASANLSDTRMGMGQPTKSSTAGYFGGGYKAAVVTTTDRITFSTDTLAAVAAAAISSARIGAMGLYDSTNGYWMGGSTGTVVNTADKMPFATEITAGVGSGALSQARKRGSSVSGASGYILGGSTTNAVEINVPQTNYQATADKFNFSTDTMAAAAGANLVTSTAGGGSLTSPI